MLTTNLRRPGTDPYRARHAKPSSRQHVSSGAMVGVLAGVMLTTAGASVNPALAAPPPTVERPAVVADAATTRTAARVAANAPINDTMTTPLARANQKAAQEALAERLAAEKAAAEKAAAAKAAAEKAAAEKADAAKAAAEKAAKAAAAKAKADAERAAAEKAAAEKRRADAARRADRLAAIRREHAAPQGEIQQYAQERVIALGYPDTEWPCLAELWTRESHWDPFALNRSSGAYGIPQALPGKKMAVAGADWETNYRTQVNWGLSYIKNRYGTPCKALQFHDNNGWY